METYEKGRPALKGTVYEHTTLVQNNDVCGHILQTPRVFTNIIFLEFSVEAHHVQPVPHLRHCLSEELDCTAPSIARLLPLLCFRAFQFSRVSKSRSIPILGCCLSTRVMSTPTVASREHTPAPGQNITTHPSLDLHIHTITSSLCRSNNKLRPFPNHVLRQP